MNLEVDTRTRILSSARELFHSRSYTDVGIKEICDSAQVQKGSFYHFFPSKRELTLAVIDELLVEFKQRIYAEAFDPFLAPMSRFRKLAELVYRFQKETADSTGHILGCPFGNIALEMSTQDEVLRRKVEAIFSQMEGLFRKTLSAAVVQGEIGDIDIDATASAMIAYIEGVMLMAKTRNDPEVIRTLMPAVSEIRICQAETAESLSS